jgi:hypothetical protein
VAHATPQQCRIHIGLFQLETRAEVPLELRRKRSVRFLRSKHLIFALTLLPFEASAQLRLTATGGGANYVGLQAPSTVTSSFTWLLPSVDGAANQCLATNGSGTLGWRTAGGTGYSLDADDGNPTNALYVNSLGNVGIGTTAPSNKLEVIGGNPLVVSANSEANNTIKQGIFATKHYLSAQPPAIGMHVYSNATDNVVYYGGATSYGNAATAHLFYTAANNTTLTGTEKMRITSTGFVGIGATTIGQKLTVDTTTAWDGMMVQSGGSATGFIVNNASGGAVMGLNAGGTRRINLDTNGTSYITGGNVGIGTTNPHSSLHVAGSLARAIVSKSGAYTATASDSVMEVNAGSGAVTITVPTAAGIAGRLYTIKKTDASANAVTVAATGGQTFDGSATISLSTQNQHVTVISNGTNWDLIASGGPGVPLTSCRACVQVAGTYGAGFWQCTAYSSGDVEKQSSAAAPNGGGYISQTTVSIQCK